MSRLPCTCCTAYLVCFITKYVFFYALAICKKFERVKSVLVILLIIFTCTIVIVIIIIFILAEFKVLCIFNAIFVQCTYIFVFLHFLAYCEFGISFLSES